MVQTIIKFLMKIRESEVKFDIKAGAIFQEVFNHPRYVNLNEEAQIELGLKWANNLYQKEVNQPSFERYLGDINLSEYCQNAIMLDLGCYLGGKTVRWIEKYQGSEIYGVDIDSRFIKIATCFANEKNVKAYFKLNFAEELDFPDGFFDIILSENTFEHVIDIRKVMQECNRVLKKAGFMIIKFPSFWNPFDHHLDLVTQTPFIHWFFKYPALLRAYFTILDERGNDALWYRRQDEAPLPYEKGYYINGTGAMEFHRLVRDNWHIVIDSFKQKTHSNNVVKNMLINCIKISQFGIFRELFPIAYILQKQ